MGHLVDQDRYKPIFYAATGLYPFSLILAAQITRFWQAVLIQGVLFVSSVIWNGLTDAGYMQWHPLFYGYRSNRPLV